MAGARLEKSRYPGVYRRGERWVYEWVDANGNRRRGTVDTRTEAIDRQATEKRKAAEGDPGESRTRLTVAAYARDLFGADLDRPKGQKPLRGRYAGRNGAIRDSTRDDYRRDLERYVLPVLGRKPIGKLGPPDLAKLAATLAERDGDDYIADRTIRRVFAPVSAMLAVAVEEGVIRHNVARDVRLPSGRDRLRRFDEDADDGDDPAPGKARALTREQLDTFLFVVDPRWRVFFELLACTGLRVSEALALRWRDVQLDGDSPVVRVHRARVRGSYGPPKSKHGRRDVPLGFGLVRALRERRAASEWHRDDDLVFPSTRGTPMSSENLARRTLKPAAQEAGASWAGYHAFRHHCASRLVAGGRNIVQVSRWLGHHSPAFTLAVYAHLMDEGVGAPIDLGGDTSGIHSGSAQPCGAGPPITKPRVCGTSSTGANRT